MKKVSRRAVCKLHRLARELEAANGVQVRWGMFRLERKQYFYFEPVPQDKSCYLHHGEAAESINEALNAFYRTFSTFLRGESDDVWKRYGWWKGVLKPARFPYDRSVYGRPGHHGKQLVLCK